MAKKIGFTLKDLDLGHVTDIYWNSIFPSIENQIWDQLSDKQKKKVHPSRWRSESRRKT